MGRIGAFLAVGATVCLLFAPPRSAEASEDSVVVAVSADCPSVTTRAELKKLLSGRATRWPDGTPVRLVLPPKGSQEMTWLAEEILGMPEASFRRFLAEKVFRGEMDAPMEAASPADAQKAVAARKGALAPLLKRDIGEGVKELHVE